MIAGRPWGPHLETLQPWQRLQRITMPVPAQSFGGVALLNATAVAPVTGPILAVSCT